MTPQNRFLTQNAICSIYVCNQCGLYHFNYRSVSLHLSRENLATILHSLYQYEFREGHKDRFVPFSFRYSMVQVSVFKGDFSLFKAAMEEAVLNEVDLPDSFYQSPDAQI